MRVLRRGLTIIELLVVITIILAITGTVIGVVSSGSGARAQREAARMVSSSIEAAKARAITNGRQVALVIHPLDNTPEGRATARTISFAEVPPPYAGDYLEATVTMTVYGGQEDSSGDYKHSNGNWIIPVGLLSVGNAGPSWGSLVQPGDLIQFNHQGAFLTLSRGNVQYVDGSGNTQTANNAWCVRWPNTITPKNVPTPTMAFKVIRTPIGKSSTGDSVTLPPQHCIDLQHSGVGEGGAGWHANNGQPVYIVFSPSGGVQGFSINGGTYPTTESIYLNVGKRENILAGGGAGDLNNLTDLSTRWISIRASTGETASRQNSAFYKPNYPQQLYEARTGRQLP